MHMDGLAGVASGAIGHEAAIGGTLWLCGEIGSGSGETLGTAVGAKEDVGG
jgi:hypothetical protein